MSTDVDSKVLDKIKKLLALSESDNIGEATNALRKAQELMIQNHLEKDDIENPEDEVIDEIIPEKDTVGVPSNKKLLFGALAKHFRCSTYYSKGRKRMGVIGYKEDVEVFKEITVYLYNAYVSLANKYVDKVCADYSRSKKIAVKNTFFIGFIKGCLSELERQVDESTALILRVPEAVEKYTEENTVKSKSSVTKALSNDSSHALNGYSSGKFAVRNKNKVIV